MAIFNSDICYLYDEKFRDTDKVNNDHVLPKQFCAIRIRKMLNLNLFKIKVHKNYNK